jgi:phthalate 4,5-dioxygenase
LKQRAVNRGETVLLSQQQNEKMCRVGASTPMGNALRHYWIPVATSDELVADGDPVVADVVGERLVAFRNSKGQVGVVAEACCHRGVSLLLGRVENCGLRCIYHGWLYAPDGKVIETPNILDERLKERISHRAYPVAESGGLVWAYLGPDQVPPPLPDLPFVRVPERHRFAGRHFVEANFVQVQEALVDSTHLGFLHRSSLAKLADATETDESLRQGTVMLDDLTPRFETQGTKFGFRYAAVRTVTDNGGSLHDVVRVTPWIAPFTILNPAGSIATLVVPMSDERTAFYHVFFDPDLPVSESPYREQCIDFAGLEPEHLSKFSLLPKSDVKTAKPARANRWLQDRAAMTAGKSFSGFPGIVVDDAAMAGSATPVRSREVEHLSHADLGVAQLYRSLLQLADAAANGDRPVGADIGDKLHPVLGYQSDLKPDESWQADCVGQCETLV